MEASTLQEVGRRRAAFARILRMGVSEGAKSSSGDTAALDELETELALLREENAQLKVERHRPADVGHVIERMRSLGLLVANGRPAGQTSSEGEHEQAIAEVLAVREGLIEACQEVQQAMQAVRGRLGALSGELDGRGGDRAKSDRSAVAAVERVEMGQVQADGGPPELARSVA
jgi:hypothetical protein